MGAEGEDRSCLLDEELALQALQGADEAWTELIRRHSHSVRLSLLVRGLALEDAEDLIQETWTKLVQQQRAGRLRELHLPGLAIAQAGWLAREAYRTRARREELAGHPVSLQRERGVVDIPDPAADAEQVALHRERLRILEEELRRCPLRAREIFHAAYGPAARSHFEAARDLGLSVQRFRQVLCEVRARLRRALEEMEKEN